MRVFPSEKQRLQGGSLPPASLPFTVRKASNLSWIFWGRWLNTYPFMNSGFSPTSKLSISSKNLPNKLPWEERRAESKEIKNSDHLVQPNPTKPRHALFLFRRNLFEQAVCQIWVDPPENPAFLEGGVAITDFGISKAHGKAGLPEIGVDL